jgi:hypothetical protein
MTNSPTDQQSKESTRLDVAVFALAVIGGLLAYFVLRALLGDRAQLYITTVLVGIMTAYAVIVVWVPRLRIRLDQAGDNSYYLGLLFTLGSMAFALYDFRAATQGSSSATGVQQIISNFGIALATTIWGIFLRVALHQMRVDPADLEAMTRVELTEAAERLRATLETVTIGMGQFHLETQQRASDIMAELVLTAKKAATNINQHTSDATIKLAAEAEERHQQILTGTQELTRSLGKVAMEALGSIERLKAVEPPPLAMSRRLDKIAVALERVAAQSDRTTDALQTITDRTNGAVDSASKTSDALATLAIRMRDEHVDLTNRLGKAANGLTEALGPFSTGLTQVLGQVSRLQQELQQSTAESVKAQSATTEVIENLSKLTKGVTEVLRSAARNPYARS